MGLGQKNKLPQCIMISTTGVICKPCCEKSVACDGGVVRESLLGGCLKDNESIRIQDSMCGKLFGGICYNGEQGKGQMLVGKQSKENMF